MRRPFVIGLGAAIVFTLALVVASAGEQPWVLVDDNTGGDLPSPTAPGGFTGEQRGSR